MLPSRTSGNNPEPQATFESLSQKIEPRATDRKSKANVTITRAEALDAQNRITYILSGTSTPSNFIDERITFATFALIANLIFFSFSSVSIRIGMVW